jgi:hypothetical protein
MRKYDIKLPYTVAAMFVPYAINRLQQAGYWKELPVELVNKILSVQSAGGTLELTQDDLDSIHDNLWKRLAFDLGVGWSPK